MGDPCIFAQFPYVRFYVADPFGFYSVLQTKETVEEFFIAGLMGTMANSQKSQWIRELRNMSKMHMADAEAYL